MIPLKISDRTVLHENRNGLVYRIKADFDAFSKEYFVTKYDKKAGILII